MYGRSAYRVPFVLEIYEVKVLLSGYDICITCQARGLTVVVD